MPRNIVVIGPPGTGKTESQITVATGWFKGGADPDQVAYLAFTRAAAKEAETRILDANPRLPTHDGKLPFFRTLHSLAFKGMSRAYRDLRLMTQADMKGFANWSGLDGKFAVSPWEDVSEAYSQLENGGKTDWDTCLTAYTLSRISCRTAEELEISKTRMSRLAGKTLGWLEEAPYQAFVKKYEAYKKANGLIDFTDMLAFALTEMEPLKNIKYAVVDEAQDLAPILHRIVDRLFQDSEEVWWAGDANQAIFGFAAADAKLFIDRIHRADHCVTLRDTHRFGQGIVDFSTRIIGRARDKFVVDVQGMPGRKHSITRTGEFQPTVERMLIVHRHVKGCQQLGAAYMAAGKPFRNERGKDPLGAEVRKRAFETLYELANGKAVASGSVSMLIDDFMPSMMVDPERRTKTRIVVHGGKKKLQEGDLRGEINLMDLFHAKILTADGIDLIRGQNLRAFKYAEDLEYYRRVVENGYSLDAKDIPVITTIHGSKGRQAPRVVVFEEMGKKCKDDMDNEHRLAYVAATRTEGDLQICAERTVDWAEETYDYPISPEAKEIDFDA